MRKWLILAACITVLLTGCGESEATLYGDRITVTGNLSNVAYIKDYSVMDCCDEYNWIFYSLLKNRYVGLFEIYEVELFDSTGDKVLSDEAMSVRWEMCDAIKGLALNDIQLYEYSNGQLVPMSFTYEEGFAEFTVTPDTFFIVVCNDGLHQVPTCAVTDCTGNCKSCS